MTPAAPVFCVACHATHERGPLYGCDRCGAVVCGELVDPAVTFHFVRHRRFATSGTVCGRLVTLDVTCNLKFAPALVGSAGE